MHEVMGARGDWFMNLIQPIAARYPYSVIPGNHETRHNFSEYRNRFTSPPPNVFFHSYNIGPIHLVMFNTEFYYSDEYGTAQLQASLFELFHNVYVHITLLPGSRCQRRFSALFCKKCAEFFKRS